MDIQNCRIAFPTNDRVMVESHFGHAKEFAFVDIKDGNVAGTDFITPPPHAPGVIPRFVGEQGADVIITGGMGGMAVDLFKQQNIEVILGAAGTISENLAVYLKGNLESTGSVCDHHH